MTVNPPLFIGLSNIFRKVKRMVKDPWFLGKTSLFPLFNGHLPNSLVSHPWSVGFPRWIAVRAVRLEASIEVAMIRTVGRIAAIMRSDRLH